MSEVVCDDIKADEHLEVIMGIETVLLLVEQQSLESILKMSWNDVYQGMESGSLREKRPKKSDRLSRLFDIDCEAEILDWMEITGAKDGSVREVLQNLSNGEEIIIVQIAGLIARRIVCEVEQGQELKQGDRIGMIRFGSRVDVYLKNKKILAKIGQNVVAGESLIASD